MIKGITILFVLLVATAIAQWNRPNSQNSGFSLWENQGNQLNQNNRPGNNQEQGSISWNNEEDSQFERPWNGQNRPDSNQNRPGNNQNRPSNQNRPTNQNRPSNQNRPGNNQNRPWDRSTTTTTTTRRSTTRRGQQSTTQRSTTSRSTTSRSTASSSTTASDFSTTASPAFTSCMTMCRTTPEYNPVCGSDSRTYSNEQRLNCAINCGLNIDLAFRGACDPA